ncbi:MAG: phosphoenolpyruvate carboxykinase (ATP) [Flavobacteriales bacterium]|nr:phosphoenolpyruvate carboxykinase (ATP) [Flavobacteriales bacterium]NNK80410.1 phosphoenolpyruvate carboxykinase (ATP) [Flavobacteriales bacterium]
MQENKGIHAIDLSSIGFGEVGNVLYNLDPKVLTDHTIEKGMGRLTKNGTLAINTGKFTGRSPQDRFIVQDDITADSVWWGDINMPFDLKKFNQLKRKMQQYLVGKDVYVRDVAVCADPDYRMNVRVVNEYPWSNLFVYNMFLRLSDSELQGFTPEWNVINAPGFHADPTLDGTRQENFAIINFSEKLVLVGGTGYTGEIKKGIFSVLNFILPYDKDVLSMHCSANVGKDGDTAIFFGLSGTGKTTLSSDEDRRLIGDDEHGWAGNSVFNFEGGCYAKTINLDPEGEPQIYHAIRPGALLENIGFIDNTDEPDYEDSSITQNTRVSYPLHFIENIMVPSIGTDPRNIFFLTADAFGALPPISKLTKGQAMYHFISGYTAKVAGTEEGIDEPLAAFSAGFGAPFLPLHPTKYAEMLGKKMEETDVNVWLLNTGWSGGAYGTGSRIKLKYTRAMITAALEGLLENVEYDIHPVFGLHMPTSCPNVPDEILNPRNTWQNKAEYDNQAQHLADLFISNFEQFAPVASEEILKAAPKGRVNA